jgi:hypothetical protein
VGGEERHRDGPTGEVRNVVRSLQEFGAGLCCGPPGDVSNAIERPNVGQPWHKVNVEEAIRVAEAMRRTLACSSQRLFRTRKLDVRDPLVAMRLRQSLDSNGRGKEVRGHGHTLTTLPSRLQT